MIKKVFKYPLVLSDRAVLDMPKDVQILTVQAQYGQPCLWALVNPVGEKEKRVFRLAGTGHPIVFDMGSDYKYINSFQLDGGVLIFHLFEMIGV